MADIVLIHGKRGCTCMRDSLPMLEDRLRRAGIIKKDLSGLITQGGYNKGGVAASAGTHDRGGSADWTGRIANDTTVRILRECGIAAWTRRPGQGRWPLHIHGIWNGCPHVSAGAARQVAAWKAGRNGLANNGRDDGPKVPIVTWKQALNAWTQTANAKPDNTGGFKPVTPQPKEEDVSEFVTFFKLENRWTNFGGPNWAAINDQGEGYSFLEGVDRLASITVTGGWTSSEPITGNVRIHRVNGAADGFPLTGEVARTTIAGGKGNFSVSGVIDLNRGNGIADGLRIIVDTTPTNEMVVDHLTTRVLLSRKA